MKFGRLGFFILILAFLLPYSSRGESFLGRGATGQEVREVQDFLIKEGFMNVSSTGYFGLATERATRDFQALWSLPGSGTWGPRTWTAKKITELKNQLQSLQSTLTTLLSSENYGYQGIDPRSIVGLSCYYEKNGVVVNRTKGSGSIISKDGLILTARHITDPSYAARVSPSQDGDFLSSAKFKYCEVYRVPEGAILPSRGEVKLINPVNRAYLVGRADNPILPDISGLSVLEEERFDVALIKLVNPPDDLKPIGLYKEDMRVGSEAISFGFPGDAAQGRGEPFSTLYLMGALGRVKQNYWGENYFSSMPMLSNLDMEVREGRSGSPVFTGGEISCVVSAYAEGNVLDSFCVTSRAINKMFEMFLPEK